MAIVQSKLQECIASTQLNSFDRLSNLFAGVNNDTITADIADGKEEDDEDEVMLTSGISAGKRSSSRGGKDASKIPAKKTTKMTGQYGDKTSRKMGEKKSRKEGSTSSRGRGRSFEGRQTGRSSSKKRGSGKKLATI
jgi:hypothetical protein